MTDEVQNIETRQQLPALSPVAGSVRFSANSASRKFRMLDLFSGIGGFALAAKLTWENDLEIIGFVEIDKYCHKVLRKNFGDVKIYEDIKTFDGTACGTVDLITGGFPCQPFSCAGKRKGKEDDRALWPEMLRVISEVHPAWVIGENVAGIVNMELDNVCASLESQGYEVQPFIIPACAVGAPHRRDRVWIVANQQCLGWPTRAGERIQSQKQISGRQEFGNIGTKSDTSDTNNTETARQRKHGRSLLPVTEPTGFNCNSWEESWYEIATRFCRVDDGISNRVDRLKSLGNAIVPRAVLPIMQAIKIINEAG